MAAAIALLALGGVASICTVVLQPHGWGLALGVGATLAGAWALPDRWWGRLPFGLGWAATVVMIIGGRAEGDYVLASDTPGYLVLAVAVIVLVLGVLSLRPHRGPSRADSGGQPGTS